MNNEMKLTNYNYDLVSSIVIVSNYIYHSGRKNSNYPYRLNILYLQKLAYFLNVMYLVKHNGKSLFLGNPFGMTSNGARIRQISIDYNRIFDYGWITHCVSNFDDVVATDKGAMAIYHTFNLKQFKANHSEAYNFIKKTLSILLTFSPNQLMDFNLAEPQCTQEKINNGEPFIDNLSYQFFSHKNNQFWLNPLKLAKHDKNKNYPTYQERIIDARPLAFEQLMNVFSKYKITRYSNLGKDNPEMPNAMMFFASNSEYHDEAKNTHYNVIFWLKDNSWNLSELDFRIEPQIKEAIQNFEKHI